MTMKASRRIGLGMAGAILTVSGCAAPVNNGTFAGSPNGPATPSVTATATEASPAAADASSAAPAAEPPATAGEPRRADGSSFRPDWSPAATGPQVMQFVAPTGFAMRVPILTYHLVATPTEAGDALAGLVVSPSLFDAQLASLQAAGWETITLATLAGDLAAGRRPPRHAFVITIDDGHVDGYTEALPILQRHGMVATYFVIAGRIGRTGYLDAAQLRALSVAGMEIGDHSMTHVDLVTKTAAALQVEVAGAATVLARVTGTYPVTFAYPFGDFSVRVADAVASAGIRMAVTTRTGAAEATDGRYEVPRVHVGPYTRPASLLAELVGLSW